MLSKFLGYFKEQNLKIDELHFLVAVSGGRDSMCLAMAFLKANLKFSIAHVNYGIRKTESDQDEILVQEFSSRNNIPFYAKKIDSTIFLNKNLQNEARKIRYAFFNDILKKEKIDFICTAHHALDSIETALLNFSKGTGIDGLSGIKSKHQKVLRPFLHWNENELIEFQKAFEVPFRVDQSNLDDKYDRNRIRNIVIPELKSIAPNLSKTALTSLDNLSDTNVLLRYFIHSWSHENCVISKEELKIPKVELLNIEGHTTLLFEILRPYSFNRSSIKSILSGLDKIGNIIHSPKAQLLIDREFLIVKPTLVLNEEKQFRFESVEVEKLEINNDPFVEFIDGDNLQHPLKTRKIKEGDKMQPLGMDGKTKKISDILIDKKYSRFEKESVRLVVHNNTPVWLIGLKLDERFKVTKETKKILRLAYLPI